MKPKMNRINFYVPRRIPENGIKQGVLENGIKQGVLTAFFNSLASFGFLDSKKSQKKTKLENYFFKLIF